MIDSPSFKSIGIVLVLTITGPVFIRYQIDIKSCSVAQHHRKVHCRRAWARDHTYMTHCVQREDTAFQEALMFCLGVLFITSTRYGHLALVQRPLLVDLWAVPNVSKWQPKPSNEILISLPLPKFTVPAARPRGQQRLFWVLLTTLNLTEVLSVSDKLLVFNQLRTGF